MTIGLVLGQMLQERTPSLAVGPRHRRDLRRVRDQSAGSLQQVFGLAETSISSPEGYLVSQMYSDL